MTDLVPGEIFLKGKSFFCPWEIKSYQSGSLGESFVGITRLVPGLLKNDTIGPREFSKWKFIILCPCTNGLWQELPLLLLWMFVQFNPSTLVNYKNGPCEFKLQTTRTLC